MNTKNKESIPKISVIITCYNYGEYIDEAINSVENQTFEDYEIIIIDDCSTDKLTQDKLSELSECVKGYIYRSGTNQVVLDGKINKLLLLKENVGVCKARNLGAKEAKGEYIIFLDADDKLHPACLELMVKEVSLNMVFNTILHKFDIIGSGYQEFGDSDSLIINKFDKSTICIENQLPISFLIKKELFLKLGGFKENMKHIIEDHDFILNAVENDCKIHILQQPLLYYRKKKESRQSSFLDSKNKRKMQEFLVKNNYKLFFWFTKEQETIIRKQKRKIKNLKNYFKIFVVSNILLIIGFILLLIKS